MKTSALWKTLRRMKRQATGSEEIFSNHISDKGLLSWLYDEFPNSIIIATFLLKKYVGWRFEQTLHKRRSIDGKQRNEN